MTRQFGIDSQRAPGSAAGGKRSVSYGKFYWNLQFGFRLLLLLFKKTHLLYLFVLKRT